MKKLLFIFVSFVLITTVACNVGNKKNKPSDSLQNTLGDETEKATSTTTNGLSEETTVETDLEDNTETTQVDVTESTLEDGQITQGDFYNFAKALMQKDAVSMLPYLYNPSGLLPKEESFQEIAESYLDKILYDYSFAEGDELIVIDEVENIYVKIRRPSNNNAIEFVKTFMVHDGKIELYDFSSNSLTVEIPILLKTTVNGSPLSLETVDASVSTNAVAYGKYTSHNMLIGDYEFAFEDNYLGINNFLLTIDEDYWPFVDYKNLLDNENYQLEEKVGKQFVATVTEFFKQAFAQYEKDPKAVNLMTEDVSTLSDAEKKAVVNRIVEFDTKQNLYSNPKFTKMAEGKGGLFLTPIDKVNFKARYNLEYKLTEDSGSTTMDSKEIVHFTCQWDGKNIKITKVDFPSAN